MGILNLFGKKKDYEPADVYLRLRNQILSLRKDQVILFSYPRPHTEMILLGQR